MSSKLQEYFPMIKEREEVLEKIKNDQQLRSVFESWEPERRKEFLDYCSGVRGFRMVYDAFFKEVMNPEYTPKRLEDFLSTVLGRKVTIYQILQNDSTRIGSESALLVTDIIVQLDDGSLANIEIQRIGYAFPGERSACYSSDMLLLKYKQVREYKGSAFSYRDIKNVYLIVIIENSTKEFRAFPHTYFHRARQRFNSGLELNLLQEYIMIPLDIFKRHMQNKDIETPLEAWLTFFSEEDPDKIIQLITVYPKFKAMYETVYQMCLNTERMMNMFSEELKQMDRNTTQYMIEEQQKEILAYKAKTEAMKQECAAVQEKCTAMQEEYTAVQGKYTAVQEKYTAVQEKCTAMQEEYTAVQGKYTAVQEKYTAVQEKYTAVQEECAAVQEKYTAVQEECTAVQEKYTAVQEENAAMKEEIALLKRQIEEIQQSLKQ